MTLLTFTLSLPWIIRLICLFALYYIGMVTYNFISIQKLKNKIKELENDDN